MFCAYNVGWQPPADIIRKIYQLLHIQYLLMMSKKCSKHLEANNRNKLKVNIVLYLVGPCYADYTDVWKSTLLRHKKSNG
jgi:hypothetical protein